MIVKASTKHLYMQLKSHVRGYFSGTISEMLINQHSAWKDKWER